MPDLQVIQQLSASINRVDAKVGTLEALFQNAIEEWSKERKELRDDIEAVSTEFKSSIKDLTVAVSKQGKFDPTLMISIVFLIIALLSMSATLILYVNKASVAPLELRQIKLGDDQDTIRKDVEYAREKIIRLDEQMRLLLDGKLKVSTQ